MDNGIRGEVREWILTKNHGATGDSIKRLKIGSEDKIGKGFIVIGGGLRDITNQGDC